MILLRNIFLLCALVGITSINTTAQDSSMVPMEDFRLVNTNGDSINLSQFKGKVIYVDFWASWCGPCIYEMKQAKKLKHKLEAVKDSIVYVYISFDDDADSWKAAIQQHHVEGVNLLNIKGREQNMARKYNIAGIPRYMFIDKKFNLYMSDASRPSEKETYLTLMELVKE